MLNFYILKYNKALFIGLIFIAPSSLLRRNVRDISTRVARRGRGGLDPSPDWMEYKQLYT